MNKKRLKWIGLALVALVVLVLTVVRGVTFFSKPPAEIGVRNGRLAPCPDKPNCVSSESEDESVRVAPLEFEGDPGAAFDRLARLVGSLPRTKIVSAKRPYLHAECRSFALGFVDDLEFLLSEEQSLIHVRSAARMGYSDLGVNRKRVDEIRERWQQKQGAIPRGPHL